MLLLLQLGKENSAALCFDNCVDLFLLGLVHPPKMQTFKGTCMNAFLRVGVLDALKILITKEIFTLETTMLENYTFI